MDNQSFLQQFYQDKVCIDLHMPHGEHMAEKLKQTYMWNKALKMHVVKCCNISKLTLGEEINPQ